MLSKGISIERIIIHCANLLWMWIIGINECTRYRHAIYSNCENSMKTERKKGTYVDRDVCDFMSWPSGWNRHLSLIPICCVVKSISLKIFVFHASLFRAFCALFVVSQYFHIRKQALKTLFKPVQNFFSIFHFPSVYGLQNIELLAGVCSECKKQIRKLQVIQLLLKCDCVKYTKNVSKIY